MIRLEGVSLSFGDVSVLDGVDLTVEEGEFVGLVGPNGAGKTTLLRVVNGIFEPDTGAVFLDGDRVGNVSSREVSTRIATVPQDTHVGFPFTAEQVVEMGRTPHRSRLDWSDDSAPVESALERTETTHLRDRAIDDLSGGERQRVLLARALAQEAPALALDEPTASLDINHQVRVLELVSDLVAEGRTAIAAIHDLDLAARYCDRLALLHDGEIRACGPPESVLAGSYLGDAFGTTAAVTQNQVTGTPTVAAIDERPVRDDHVHVAGSGSEAASAVRTLWKAGFEVSLGVVPEGDVAAQLASQLDLRLVTAQPFTTPDETSHSRAVTLAREADVVVLTNSPGSNVVSADIDDVPRVHAHLDSETRERLPPRPARVDGGEQFVAESEEGLVSAVLDRLSSRGTGDEDSSPPAERVREE